MWGSPMMNFRMSSNKIIQLSTEIADEYMQLGKVIAETHGTNLEEGLELAKILISKMPDDIITASHKLQVLARAGQDLRALIKEPERVDYLYTLAAYISSCSPYYQDKPLERRNSMPIAELYRVYKNPDNKYKRYRVVGTDNIIYYNDGAIQIQLPGQLPVDINYHYSSTDLYNKKVERIIERKMTISEIEEELGYAIQVIGE